MLYNNFINPNSTYIVRYYDAMLSIRCIMVFVSFMNIREKAHAHCYLQCIRVPESTGVTKDRTHHVTSKHCIRSRNMEVYKAIRHYCPSLHALWVCVHLHLHQNSTLLFLYFILRLTRQSQVNLLKVPLTWVPFAFPWPATAAVDTVRQSCLWIERKPTAEVLYTRLLLLL